MSAKTVDETMEKGKANDTSATFSTIEIDDCGPWVKVIEEATSHGFGHGNRSSSLSVEEGIQRVDRSLIFLEELQILLEQQEHKERPPMNPPNPPSFVIEDHQDELRGEDQRRNNPLSRIIASSTSKPTKQLKKTKTKRQVGTSPSKNRYAAFADESDASSAASSNDSDRGIDDEKKNNDDSGIEEITTRDAHMRIGAKFDKSLSPEAIPYIPSLSLEENDDDSELRPQQLQANQEQPGQSESNHMDAMRLLIRLHASQSDLHAKKARLLQVQHKWLLGAGSLQSSIVALRKGLELADSAISAMDIASERENTTGWVTFSSPQELMTNYHVPTLRDGIPSSTDIAEFADHRRAQLQMDAEITSVSVHYLITEKSRYIRSANVQVAKLEKILQPMWKGRNAARKRIGDGKWKSNPKSKSQPSTLTKTRQRHEEELWAIEEALRQLEFSETEASALAEEADQLREKLKELRFAKNRYNGRRPKRFSPQTVMDPKLHDTEGLSNPEQLANQYGWTFTGSIEGVDCVLFFEKWVDAFEDVTQNLAPSIPESIIVPSLSADSDDEVIVKIGDLNGVDDNVAASCVLVKLDYYFVTGAIQTVVEYPPTYNDMGVLLQNAWTSTLAFNIDKDDFNSCAIYRQMMANPLSTHRLYGGTNVVVMQS